MEPIDELRLGEAVQRLEHPGLAISIAEKVGMPIDLLMKRLPDPVQAMIGKAIHRGLERCLEVALRGMGARSAVAAAKRGHTLLAAATGAAGGFFGLPGLLFELPVSTTLMLHSIAEIARSHGEDLADPESALNCLQVFALGAKSTGKATDSAYYATRAALAQATREAASFIAEKGLVKTGAPVLVRFLSMVSGRFGVEVAEKAAAQMVPMVGAAGGAALNALFTTHFQTVAEAHFTVRELERAYGSGEVRRRYSLIAARKGPVPQVQ
jgi:hypothetical protein